MALEQQVTEQQGTAQQPVPRDDEDDISIMELLLGFLIVVGRHRKLVFGLPILAGIMAVAVSLMMTPIYNSTAKIMPPSQASSSAAAMLGQLGGLIGMSGAGPKNSSDIYVGMLQSRTVADSLINRLQLKERYNAQTMDDARGALQAVSQISSGKKDGMISITVSDPDPKFAATMANAYVEELIKLTQTLAVSEASMRRLFFEKQLEAVKDNLANAEVAMRQTQEKTGVISPEGQVGSLIGSIAQLRGMIAAKEVQVKAMQTYATGQNPDLLRTQEELRGLRAQLAKLEKGQAGDAASMLSTGKVPEAGVEYVRAMRNVKYYETMFEMLAKQYELARIDESKDASTIQLMDEAVPAERKAKPKRAMIVLLSVIVAGILGVMIAYVLEGYRRVQEDAENRARWQQVASAWKK